jgi:hypothetical protein
VYGKERKNEKKLYVNERRKRKRWGSNKDMRGMDQVKEKRNKV